MRFIRFDKESEGSQSLQTNKFAVISEICDRFIENSQSYYFHLKADTDLVQK